MQPVYDVINELTSPSDELVAGMHHRHYRTHANTRMRTHAHTLVPCLLQTIRLFIHHMQRRSHLRLHTFLCTCAFVHTIDASLQLRVLLMNVHIPPINAPPHLVPTTKNACYRVFSAKPFDAGTWHAQTYGREVWGWCTVVCS